MDAFVTFEFDRDRRDLFGKASAAVTAAFPQAGVMESLPFKKDGSWSAVELRLYGQVPYTEAYKIARAAVGDDCVMGGLFLAYLLEA